MNIWRSRFISGISKRSVSNIQNKIEWIATMQHWFSYILIPFYYLLTALASNSWLNKFLDPQSVSNRLKEELIV
jgi:hypothetical protein